MVTKAKANIDKICPLASIFNVIARKNMTVFPSLPAGCDRDRCMWWNEKKKQCGVLK
jgi:hypothetical protein